MYNIQGSINDLLRTAGTLAVLDPSAKHRAEQFQAGQKYKQTSELGTEAQNTFQTATDKWKSVAENPDATPAQREAVQRDFEIARQVAQTATASRDEAAKNWFMQDPKKGAPAYIKSLQGQQLVKKLQAMDAANANAQVSLAIEQDRVSATKRDREPIGFGGV